MKEMRIPSAFMRVVFFAILISFFAAPTAFAADFSVTPAVIDAKGKTREILRYTMTVENETKRMLQLYPWVADLDADSGATGSSDLGGGSPSDSRDSSPSRWIEVSRAVIDILPGEKKEIPLLIQIGINAKPGMYHAIIHVSDGGTRAVAESNIDGTRDVAINIEVLDDAHERLALNTFVPDKNFFSGDEASFNFGIENIGNRGLTPTGKIHIYDRQGKEVAAIEANTTGRRLEPSQKELLASVWSADGNFFGRYKAMLELEYGTRGTVQDTVYFWIMPWKKLLGMFGTLCLLGVLLAITIHSWGLAQRGPKRRFSFSILTPFHRYPETTRDFDNNSQVKEKHNPYIDGATEVSIPPPTRTRYRITRDPVPEEHDTRSSYSESSTPHREVRHESSHHAHTSGHQVHLTKKEKQINPNHIVKLGKRSS